MEILKGIGVSPGVVISTAVVLDAEGLRIPERSIQPTEVAAELSRLDTALKQSAADLTVLRDDVASRAGKELAGIFDFHLAMLKDKAPLSHTTGEIPKPPPPPQYPTSAARTSTTSSAAS